MATVLPLQKQQQRTEAKGSVFESPLLQAKYPNNDLASLQTEEAKQLAPANPNTGIPADMKKELEELSGFSFDDVQVHYQSDKPKKLQALAYTQGNEVHIGPGQEQHLRHELGHVVQQKAGLVQATGILDGVPINEDASLEQNADYLSKTALQYIDSGHRVQSSSSQAPVQRKNANNIELNDFSDFLQEDARQRAYALWQANGSPQNQTQAQQDAEYYAANRLTDDEKKAAIKQALTSTDPATHPETQTFKQGMQAVGITDDALIDIIWSQILAGIAAQSTHNNNARVLLNTNFLQSLHNQANQANRTFIYSNDNDNIRNDNAHFKLVSELVEPYLTVRRQNKDLALWSGGYDLSPYATRRGFVTLEESPFGKVLDRLYLSDNWNLIGPLWNIISKSFVKKYINEGGTEFHVLIRAYDPASVLIRQEVDQIYAMFEGQAQQPRIHWHCIVQDPNTNLYAEITKEGEVDTVPDRDQSTTSESDCLGRLIGFYERQPDGNRSKKTMVDGFKGTLDISFDEALEHLAVERYRILAREEAYAVWERAGSPANQSPENRQADYFAGEAALLPRLIQERIVIMSYFLWQAKGAKANQSEEEKQEDYLVAEENFNATVKLRKAAIQAQRAATADARIRTKAYHLWQSKGAPQQSKEAEEADYFAAKQMIAEEDNAYFHHLENQILLEVALGIRR